MKAFCLLFLSLLPFISSQCVVNTTTPFNLINITNTVWVVSATGPTPGAGAADINNDVQNDGYDLMFAANLPGFTVVSDIVVACTGPFSYTETSVWSNNITVTSYVQFSATNASLTHLVVHSLANTGASSASFIFNALGNLGCDGSCVFVFTPDGNLTATATTATQWWVTAQLNPPDASADPLVGLRWFRSGGVGPSAHLNTPPPNTDGSNPTWNVTIGAGQTLNIALTAAAYRNTAGAAVFPDAADIAMNAFVNTLPAAARSIYNFGPYCGNSIIDGAETCDDGNALSGDGCSAACLIEAGFACTGQPSVCTRISSSSTAGSTTSVAGSTSTSAGSALGFSAVLCSAMFFLQF